MSHYSDQLLSPVTIKKVSDNSRFYQGVPNNSTPFLYNGTVNQLKALLDSGDFIIVSGADKLSVVTTDLEPQAEVSPGQDFIVSNFLTDYLVSNNGPVATLGADGITITLDYGNQGGGMPYDPNGPGNDYVVKVNGTPVTVSNVTANVVNVTDQQVYLTLASVVSASATVTVSKPTQNYIIDANLNYLPTFTNELVTNHSTH